MNKETLSEKEIEEKIEEVVYTVKEHQAFKKVGALTIAGGVLGTIVPVIGTAIGIATGAIIGGIRVLTDEIKGMEDDNK